MVPWLEVLEPYIYVFLVKVTLRKIWDHAAGYIVVAGYFLNPEFYYRNAQLHPEAIDTDLRVGLREVLKRLLNEDDQIDAIQELSIYTQRRGTFADSLVQRSIGRMPPVDWWMNYGESAPHLRRAVVRILSQTTTSSNCERNWSTFSLIHTKPRNRPTMHKLNKLVYRYYILKLRNRTRERRARDDPAYCPINLDRIFREDNPLFSWLAEIEDPLLDSNLGFQQTVQGLIDEEMGERQPQKVSHLKAKVPVQVHIGVEKNLLILYLLTKVVPPPSLRVAMVEEMGEMEEETVGQVVLEYYQHDDKDAVPVEDVQEFPETERFDPNCGYQRRQRVSPLGNSNEQGNMGGDVGGEHAALWNPCYSEPQSDSWPHPQGPSHYFQYGQLQQEDD